MPHTPPLTSNQGTIISLLHIKDWNTAVVMFAGLTKEQIFTLLADKDPLRENMQLMELIFREMPRYLDAHQVAEITGLAEVTITKRCQCGELPGAFKKSYTWTIPATAARTLKRNPSRWDNPEWHKPSMNTAIDGIANNGQRKDSPPPLNNLHENRTNL